MDYGKVFSKGGWAALGRYYALHPKKLAKLYRKAFRYASRPGLRRARMEFVLICHYVRDVFLHRYTDYNPVELTLIVGAFAYVVSPWDLVPDWLPLFGLADDMGLLAWATKRFGEELGRYRRKLRAEGAEAKGMPERGAEDAFRALPDLAGALERADARRALTDGREGD